MRALYRCTNCGAIRVVPINMRRSIAEDMKTCKVCHKVCMIRVTYQQFT